MKNGMHEFLGMDERKRTFGSFPEPGRIGDMLLDGIDDVLYAAAEGTESLLMAVVRLLLINICRVKHRDFQQKAEQFAEK